MGGPAILFNTAHASVGDGLTPAQRQLNVAAPAVVAIYEILQEEWNIALLQIAAPAQFVGNVG
jgi:hypothetical protein